MKNTVAEIQEKYDAGHAVLKTLFLLPLNVLRDKLNEICGSKLPYNEPLIRDGTVKKISENDEPESIEVWYYDCLEINSFGIYFKPEHGESKEIVSFDKFFKLS